MYDVTVTMFVELVLELNPTVMPSSVFASMEQRRHRILAALTSTRVGTTKKQYDVKDHLAMQGGHMIGKVADRHPTGKYGADHFPFVTEFPKGRITVSKTATEFDMLYESDTLNNNERIAWLYHRIRVLNTKFLTCHATHRKYDGNVDNKE